MDEAADKAVDKARPAVEPDLERIIDKLSTEHSFDVRGYRRASLYRRIRKRLADAGARDAEEYLVRLESDPKEHAQLINTILIHVTRLFRDPEAWEHLQRECLPDLVRHRQPGGPVRVWSAGCATGEEAYSLAISLIEALGEASLRDLKIYATDVDEAALAVARAGVYEPEDLQLVSEARLARFFEPVPGGNFRVRREVRGLVIFGRHNVLEDPPISRVDLLCCRNLLIYLDGETQTQLLSRFHYAVRPGGYLFLGKAETLMARSPLFRAVEPRFRLFQRPPAEGDAAGPVEPLRAREPAAAPLGLLQDLVAQARMPLLLLDPAGRVLVASDPARELLQLAPHHLGRTLRELAEGQRPAPLRLAIDEVRATGRPARIEAVQVPRRSGPPAVLLVDVQPIRDARGELPGILVWASDVSREHQLAAELSQVRHDLEALNEELQCTNEELETSNEELQCTNEELETTNEELQSTNQELEATVEELQSTNEELETANEELLARQEELNALNRYQDLILSSLETGLIVLDQALCVTSWNRRCEETWGLRAAEAVGRDLLGLDIGLPLRELREPLSRLARGDDAPAQLTLSATDRRGRPLRCRLLLSPLRGENGPAPGVMIIIQEQGVVGSAP